MKETVNLFAESFLKNNIFLHVAKIRGFVCGFKIMFYRCLVFLYNLKSFVQRFRRQFILFQQLLFH